MSTAVPEIESRVQSREGGYVCFVNVHLSVTGRTDSSVRTVLNNSYMSMPDGKPLSWVARMQGLRDVSQVAGPDFMEKLISHKGDVPLRHYFYGGKEEVLNQLIGVLSERFPNAEIVGHESPPFRELTVQERQDVIDRIRGSAANVVWVGLGAPKQERWMANNWQELKPALLMGVGAGFDFHSGALQRAPEVFRGLGLEWLYRLCQEPRRLSRRYFVTNLLFVWYLFRDAVRPVDSKGTLT